MKYNGIDNDCFRLAVESFSAGIFMTNSEGVVRFANAEAERMFGYADGELVGKPIDILVPAPLRHSHAALRQGFLANPSKRAMGLGRDLKGTRRDGTDFPLEIGLTPIEAGGETIVLAIIVSITGRREAESALARRAVELEQANERLAQFAYVASHDLQEPLRKIAMFSNLLDEAIAGGNQSDMTRASAVIRSSALHARELVADLLTFSRTINSEQELQVLDVRETIAFALTALSESIAETNSKIEIDIPNVAVKADRSQFVRLIQNIVSNAIKYRKPGRAAGIKIAISFAGGSALQLEIADDGIGFEEKYARAIFEPFTRLHTKSDYPGSGIGLAICKAIADRHEWRISAKSQPGNGATFCVLLQTSLQA